MSTQIQQQQVQGLSQMVGDLTTVSGNLNATGQAVSANLVATGYALQTAINKVSGDLIGGSGLLSGRITTNTNAIYTTGQVLSASISAVSGNLSASGTTLVLSIAATGATNFTRLTTSGVALSGTIKATGDTLQLEIDALSPDSIVGISGAANYANYSLASDFRLNDYVLQTSLTGIPTGTLREASSVCYNPSGCTYLVLSPDPIEAPSIKEFEFGGTAPVRSTFYDWPTNYSDVEGITHVVGNQFALCSEFKTSTSKDAILLFDYIGNSSLGGTIPPSDFTIYDVDTADAPLYEPPVNNAGLEGISYNPQKQVFYGAVEGSDATEWKVIEITLGEAPPPEATGSSTSVKLFSSGTVNFSPNIERLSDIYYDPNSRHLFLTDHGASNAPDSDRSRVFECDLQGNLIHYVDLKDSQGNNYNQMEGITFSPDGGRMVIVGEAGEFVPGGEEDVGSDLGFYTTSSFATSGVYKIPAVMSTAGLVSGGYTLTAADNGTYVNCNDAAVQTITLPTTVLSGQFDGFQCDVFNEGVGAVQIRPIGYKAKGGALGTNMWCKIWCLTGMWYAAGDIA